MEEGNSLRGNDGPRHRHAADGWPANAPYRHIAVRPLTRAIGAEIEGVDLARIAEGPALAEIRRALAEHLVIFFRDQAMTPDQQAAFGRLFGELDVHPAAPHAPGRPELMVVAAGPESKRANGEGWHSDVSCLPEPPMGSILRIAECPDDGGDTLFASMYAAWESLSDRLKAYLDGLEAVHDGEPVYRGMYADLGVADRPSYPRARHPVARTHPVTGRKCLYVNRGFTVRIQGVPADESAAILRYLFDHAENPLFQCRFRWRPGSVAFWDNRCVQHRAMWDYWPDRRFGHRVTIKGDRPV